MAAKPRCFSVRIAKTIEIMQLYAQSIVIFPQALPDVDTDTPEEMNNLASSPETEFLKLQLSSYFHCNSLLEAKYLRMNLIKTNLPRSVVIESTDTAE